MGPRPADEGEGDGDGAPDRPGWERAPDLAGSLSALARDLEDEGDLGSTLDAIVRAAVGTVPGAEHASISTVRAHRYLTTRAASGDLAVAVDRAQNEAHEGPCLDVLYEKRTARVPDTARERRWPRFGRRAADLGVGSLLCVQLFIKGEDLGALSLGSAAPGSFDEESEHVALLFATHAAIAMVGAQKEDQLRDALGRRDLIGQAMGVLMERHDLTSERAFSVLVRLSHHSNRKVVELAHEILERRDLPGAPDDG